MNPGEILTMKIETASLEHGSHARRVVYDDADHAGREVPKPEGPRGPWAWIASMARHACGIEDKPENTLPEIETR